MTPDEVNFLLKNSVCTSVVLTNSNLHNLLFYFNFSSITLCIDFRAKISSCMRGKENIYTRLNVTGEHGGLNTRTFMSARSEEKIQTEALLNERPMNACTESQSIN